MKKIRIMGINRHRMYIDGQGINTLVALEGCPLKCKYCINKNLLAGGKVQEMSLQELAEKVLIDYCYFMATGGGVTFGGGEALLHSGQIKAFREVLPKDVPIKVETSLNVPTECLLDVIDVVDEFIIDIKSMNPQIYKEYTGLDNSRLVENLEILCEKGLQDKCKIRIPNIPGFTVQADIDKAADSMNSMGFKNLEIFDYVMRGEKEWDE